VTHHHGKVSQTIPADHDILYMTHHTAPMRELELDEYASTRHQLPRHFFFHNNGPNAVALTAQVQLADVSVVRKNMRVCDTTLEVDPNTWASNMSRETAPTLQDRVTHRYTHL
jgi:hypothetical protein